MQKKTLKNEMKDQESNKKNDPVEKEELQNEKDNNKELLFQIKRAKSVIIEKKIINE